MMKNLRLLYLLIFWTMRCSVSDAQDSVLMQPHWRSYFLSLTEFNEEAYKMTFKDFDQRYQPGMFYHILLVFRAQGKTSKEELVLFTGLNDLCDPKKPLLIKQKFQNSTYPIDKKNLLAFVFDKFAFKINYPGLRDTPSARWGIIVINGPIHTIKDFRVEADPSGPMFHDNLTTLKYDKPIGSDPKSLGGFSFKKGMSKLVSDYAELSARILNTEPGYLKENFIAIIKEYNMWIKDNDPAVYDSYVYLKP